MEKIQRPLQDLPCISLIGMAGAGKSTVGKALAHLLNWAYLDSDYLIEAAYAARLQDITDACSRDEFLDLEKIIVCAIKAGHAVIATGGSVIYREESMLHLQRLGPVVHISASTEEILARIRQKPDRGLILSPGQSLEDLMAERRPLYQRWATLTLECGQLSPAQCASSIAESLEIAEPSPPATS